MIQFNTPEWFFLIPLLLAAGWKYRCLRLASPLRLLLQGCLLLFLILASYFLAAYQLNLRSLIIRTG